ncbi:helix-turn-helix transcriptional regulator [Frankia sp. CNm7]|uniref:helix-turn-helix transcriptional regulator n=1 Tax=Frankia nepalensis TaxID=1836974 RepID=UPI0019342363|nr:helix-turn-helix transcriptional regulator [Frankia nepalensis]MBL7515296.1 helix-turn-helix transcriptional regulator [Frankia nepalensis]MBL7523582.1 helix-turn-helix transcriptional regulator [Frankia nepalensis]
MGDSPDPGALAATLSSFGPSGWRSYLLARLALVAGRPTEAEELLEDAWARCQAPPEAGANGTEDGATGDGATNLGVRVAALFAMLHSTRLDPVPSVRWARLAQRLAPGWTGQDMLRFFPATAKGTEESTRDGPDEPAAARGSIAELDLLLARAERRMRTDDLAGVHADLVGLLPAASDRSAQFRIYTTLMRALVDFRTGRWDEAIVHGDLGIALAVDADHAVLTAYGHAIVARVYAMRGDWDAAERHVRAVAAGEALTVVVHRAWANIGFAHARADPAAVADALAPVPAWVERLGDPGAFYWAYQALDGLGGLDDLDRAAAIVEPLAALAARHGPRSAVAGAMRARAALAAAGNDRSGAEAAFRESLTHLDGLGLPFDEALTRLGLGAFLRRAGRRTAAAEQLRAAHRVFDRLGAMPYVERCDRELAACGLAPRARETPAATRLTPQEMAVARRAVELTNRDIAKELFISVKTVEFHLRNVYAKLQVTTRAQLRVHLAQRREFEEPTAAHE